MRKKVEEFLLAADPWVEYRTRIDLLGEDEKSEQAQKARNAMLKHQLIRTLLAEMGNWPGQVLSSHKSAGQLYHKLVFLCDIGLTQQDDGMDRLAEKILDSASEEGIFQLPMNIPEHFGGSGKDEAAWALCDAPLLTYCLAKLGYAEDARVQTAKNQLKAYSRDNGYPCAVSKKLGKFRGPGKKDDPCPYATLIMLKLLGLNPGDSESPEATCSIETLLSLWEKSESLHPYMFYMGTDFRKLKAPLVWYDIVNVADTLSNYAIARHDKRFKSMVTLLKNKADSEGLYQSESIWTAWSAWEFGQKKQPSTWLTFLVTRVMSRMQDI